MHAYIRDNEQRNLRADASTWTIQTIEYEHHEIHSGSHYEYDSFVDLGAAATRDIRIVTPDTEKWAHIVWEVDVEDETAWFLYEDAVIVAAGTAIVPYNSNRNSANTSKLTMTYIDNDGVANANLDTTVSGATTLGSGVTPVGIFTGGGDERNHEIILKQNTTYSLRFIANSAGIVDYAFSWYEHTDKN